MQQIETALKSKGADVTRSDIKKLVDRAKELDPDNYIENAKVVVKRALPTDIADKIASDLASY